MPRGSQHSFLDQTFDFDVEGGCSVTMEGYTADLLEMRSTTKTASTPALEDLFIVDESSDPLWPKPLTEMTVVKLSYQLKLTNHTILYK